MTYQEFLARYDYELNRVRFSANFLGYDDGLACYSYGQHSKVVFYLGSMFHYVDFPVLHSPYDSNFHHLYSPNPFHVPFCDHSTVPLNQVIFGGSLVSKYFLSFLKGDTYYYYSASSEYIFDTFEDALNYCGDAIISGTLSNLTINHMISASGPVLMPNGFNCLSYVGEAFSYLGLSLGACCYPDFSSIVKALGGFPVTDQFQNLKMICQLLGVDTNTTLENCEAMKEYLKRIVQVLGGFSQNEPNDNLKIICDLLGVDSDPQGLSDCDLSKDYVKRISKMLGAE